LPSAANARPIPRPISAALISMSCGEPCATAIRPYAAAVNAEPTITAVFDPNRAAILPVNEPTMTMPIVDGRR